MGDATALGAAVTATTTAAIGMLSRGGPYRCMRRRADMAAANAGIAAVVSDGVAAAIIEAACGTTAAGKLPIQQSTEPGHTR